MRAIYAFLDCGIPESGVARVYCDGCGHDYFVAFSCRMRVACPFEWSSLDIGQSAAGTSERNRRASAQSLILTWSFSTYFAVVRLSNVQT